MTWRSYPNRSARRSPPNHQVTWVATGAIGVERVRALLPDVVLLDLLLPDQSGLAVYEQIRAISSISTRSTRADVGSEHWRKHRQYHCGAGSPTRRTNGITFLDDVAGRSGRPAEDRRSASRYPRDGTDSERPLRRP